MAAVRFPKPEGIFANSQRSSKGTALHSSDWLLRTQKTANVLLGEKV